MRLRATLLMTLLTLAALGCATRTGADSSAGAASTQTNAASAATRPDLSSYFKQYPAGAFVLYDAEFVIKWDSKKYPAFNQDALPFSAWWQDQTLRTAFKRSVVWYYRELALQVGERRMKEYVNKLDYGNEDASGPLNGFWLNSTLKISADEQVEFLRRPYKEELPVSRRSVSIVKEIMTLEETPDYKLSGKTGGGPLGENRFLGWFVGYLETTDNTYFFATEIEGPTYLSIRDERIALTKRILKGLGRLKN